MQTRQCQAYSERGIRRSKQYRRRAAWKLSRVQNRRCGIFHTNPNSFLGATGEWTMRTHFFCRRRHPRQLLLNVWNSSKIEWTEFEVLFAPRTLQFSYSLHSKSHLSHTLSLPKSLTQTSSQQRLSSSDRWSTQTLCTIDLSQSLETPLVKIFGVTCVRPDLLSSLKISSAQTPLLLSSRPLESFFPLQNQFVALQPESVGSYWSGDLRHSSLRIRSQDAMNNLLQIRCGCLNAVPRSKKATRQNTRTQHTARTCYKNPQTTNSGLSECRQHHYLTCHFQNYPSVSPDKSLTDQFQSTSPLNTCLAQMSLNVGSLVHVLNVPRTTDSSHRSTTRVSAHTAFQIWKGSCERTYSTSTDEFIDNWGVFWRRQTNMVTCFLGNDF